MSGRIVRWRYVTAGHEWVQSGGPTSLNRAALHAKQENIDTAIGLPRLMADAHKRRFDVVCVWRFDRFARSVSHLLRALLQKHSRR